MQPAKTRWEIDCGPDHELLIAKIRLKVKKVGKTTPPFRHDLNPIPYDDAVAVTNRLRVLDLIDRVTKELWRRFVTLYRKQWPKPSSRKRNEKRKNGCLKRTHK